MKNLIIVEGPDCSGKSTLAKYLVHRLGGVYWHASGHRHLHGGMGAYHANIIENIEWNLRHNPQCAPIILDRSWISEYVYANIFRPAYRGLFPYEAVRERIKILGGIYIICDHEKILELHDKERNPEHAYTNADFWRVVQDYRMFWKEHRDDDDYAHYDMNKQTHQQVAEMILRWE
jgi:thymidylate kinase